MISKGQETVESAVVKRYIGIGSVSVLAVNPNKEKLESIYGTTIENAPEYVSVDANGKKQVRIDFVVKTNPVNPCNNGIEMTTKVTFFIKNEYRVNRDSTKVQVIDKYARTCWVTKEQNMNHEIPMYANGPANIDKDYRPCYVGEEEFTNFVKTYLNIPDVMRYVNNVWVMSENPNECMCRFDNIVRFFNGDFSELEEVINFQPNNHIKVLFGVKRVEDKLYQAAFTQMFVRNRSSKYDRLEKELNERKANGAYPTTEFAIDNLKEYSVEPTSFAVNALGNSFEQPQVASPWDF